MSPSLLRRAFALLPLMLPACGTSGASHPATDASLARVSLADASGPTLAVTLVPNPDNVVSAVATVLVTGATHLVITVDDGGDGGVRTTTVRVTSSAMRLPVLGLTPGVTSRVTFTATADDGGRTSTGPIAVTMGPLPAAFPAITVHDHGLGAQDHVLLGILHYGTNFSAAVIVDRRGRLEWYRLGGAPSTFGLDFERTPTGSYTVFQSGTAGFFEELDLTSKLLRRWTAPGSALGLDGHEFSIGADGHALALVPTVHTDDTRPFRATGAAAANVLGVEIHDLAPDGSGLRRWSSWPAIGLDETTADVFAAASEPLDALHPNSLSRLADGNLLLSLRHTDTVLKIDAATGKILWRLGGVRSDFRFVGDPAGGFSHQHYVRELGNGDLLLLDNGNLHDPPGSRAVEYRLDEAAHTATRVWEYDDPLAGFSLAAGSAQRLGNGHTLVSWGFTGQVAEVDAAGAALWNLGVAGCMVYRAIAVPEL